MKWIAYDLESEDGGSHIQDKKVRWGPQYRKITQCAAICGERENADHCWYWCVPPETNRDTKTIPGGYFPQEERMLYHFLVWILMQATYYGETLYLVAHNGLLSDIPKIEERVLQILEKNRDTDTQQYWRTLLQNPMWNQIYWADSQTMAYKKWRRDGKNYKLVDCYQRVFGCDIEEAHQAYADTEALQQIILNASMESLITEGRKSIWAEKPSMETFPMTFIVVPGKPASNWRKELYDNAFQEVKQRYSRWLRWKSEQSTAEENTTPRRVKRRLAH